MIERQITCSNLPRDCISCPFDTSSRLIVPSSPQVASCSLTDTPVQLLASPTENRMVCYNFNTSAFMAIVILVYQNLEKQTEKATDKKVISKQASLPCDINSQQPGKRETECSLQCRLQTCGPKQDFCLILDM